MSTTEKPPLSPADAAAATTEEPSEDVKAWQARKIAAGIKAADEGRFASPEDVRAVIQNTSRMDELHWTEEALQDLDDIGAYIALDGPRAAETVIRRIVEAVAALAWHPRLGRVSQDGATRELVVSGTPYIAIYRLRERIEIITIFHASRKWPDSFDAPGR